MTAIRDALRAIIDTLDAEEMGEGPPASEHVAHWQKLHDDGTAALAAWNRRAPASVPEDVAGVVERLRGYRPANEWGDPVQHTICDEAASALARVAKERDEARATLDEVCLSNRQEWQRATSAEAKLAEALADRAALGGNADA